MRPSKEISQQRFLVTGCASGIGRQLAHRLLENGARVTATDLNESTLQDAAKAWPGGEARLQHLDVTDPVAWERVLDETLQAWGGLDVVVNVAGYLKPGAIHEATASDVDRHFDVNVKGLAHGTRLVAARWISKKSAGHIINIASMAALAPIPGLGLYSASKYAVRAFSLAAAEELRPHGIAVTTICPDAVATPMLDLQVDFPEAALTFTAPRVLTADDIVTLILGTVHKKKPLLVSMPRRRALLARFADLFPGTSRWIAPALERRGRKRQQALRDAQTLAADAKR